MSDFRDLILKHRGKVIAVIGGAPFDPALLDGIKADVWISANEHGVKVRECDYIVAMDENNSANGQDMQSWLAQYSKAPVIGPQAWADYQLNTWPDCPRRSFLSGMAAVWCAWAMGAKAVVVVGMNGYDGKHSALRDMRLVLDTVSVPVRSVDGGALLEVVQEYDKDEKFGYYKESPKIKALLEIDEEITVRVAKPTTVRGAEREKGYEFRAMRHEVARLLKHKMLVEV